MSKTPPAPLPVGATVGEYRILRKISAGGFGVVYLAADSRHDLFAIKEYLPASFVSREPGQLIPQIAADKLSLYRSGLRSFFEEGRSLASIIHPAVVAVHNFLRANETVYMVMNYLDGVTLQELILAARSLKRPKIFRESTIYSLFDELSRGLRIVHQHRVLHLDLKPANIIVTNANRAVMIDFGAARQVLNAEVSTLRPVFTPGFAAPEMYRRHSKLGPWTDIYALGACVFACMQGHPPSDAQKRMEKDKLSASMDRLRGVYSDGLLDLVQRCMALDSSERPQSVFSLQQAFEQACMDRYALLRSAPRSGFRSSRHFDPTMPDLRELHA